MDLLIIWHWSLLNAVFTSRTVRLSCKQFWRGPLPSQVAEKQVLGVGTRIFKSKQREIDESLETRRLRKRAQLELAADVSKSITPCSIISSPPSATPLGALKPLHRNSDESY
jgi:hypothetical protein